MEKTQKSVYRRRLAGLMMLLMLIAIVFSTEVMVRAEGTTAENIENVVFSYAYDAQRSPVYPKKGEAVRGYSLKYPLLADGNHGTTYAGQWKLCKIGTYANLEDSIKGSGYLRDIVESIATNYSVSQDIVVVHELKDQDTHIAYGVTLAYDSNNGVVFFLGDTWSGGAGYMLSTQEQTGTINISANLDVTDWTATVEVAPAITVQPEDQTCEVGEAATFKVIATGTNLNYQWQIWDENSGAFSDIPSANNDSYTTSEIDKASDGKKYQCVVSNSLGSVTSNVAVLKVKQSATQPQDPKPVKYAIVDGANSSYVLDSDGKFSIRGDGEFSRFESVKVDEAVIDPQYYTVEEGSTIVTLKSDYMNTLAAGSHTFEIVWTDGTARTAFSIVDNDDDDDYDDSNDNSSDASNQNLPVAPKTGDATHLFLWISLMITSMVGMLGYLLVGKRVKN